MTKEMLYIILDEGFRKKALDDIITAQAKKSKEREKIRYKHQQKIRHFVFGLGRKLSDSRLNGSIEHRLNWYV